MCQHFFPRAILGKKILRKYFYRNASMFSTIANSSLILSSDVCCMMRRATSFRLSEGWQKATTTMLLRGCHLICSHQSPSAGKSQRLALVSRTSSILTFLLLFSLGIGQTDLSHQACIEPQNSLTLEFQIRNHHPKHGPLLQNSKDYSKLLQKQKFDPIN